MDTAGHGRRLVAAGWALGAVLVVTAALLLPAQVHTPGYFTVLEVHRAAGFAALVAGPIVLLAHMIATGSRVGAAVAVAALVGLTWVAMGATPAALDFPESVGLIDLQRRLLTDAVQNRTLDSGPLAGAAALAALLGAGALLTLVGVLSRARTRAASRWSGAALVVLTTWALAGGAGLHLQHRDDVFGALTLHSVAGTGTLALLLLHLGARRAARANVGRPLLAAGGAVWMLGVAATWWVTYDREHFSGFRPATVGDVFTLHRTTDQPDPSGRMPPPPAPADRIPDSLSCGASNCHEQVTREWAGSLHRFSAANAFYRAAVHEAMQRSGPDAAIFCAGCHDPDRVLTGAVPDAYALGVVPESGSDGVSCVACHGIVEVDHGEQGVIGNGRATVALDAEYPGEGERLRRNIRLDPRRHRQRFVTNGRTLATGTTCMACHRLEVGEGPGGPFVLQHAALFDDLRHASSDGCTGCHLPQDAMSIYTHRMAGIAVDLPLFALGATDQDRVYMEEYRAAVRDLTGIRDRRPLSEPPEERRRRDTPESRLAPFAGTFVSLRIEPELVDDALLVRHVSKNVSVGHPFPSGPLDLNEVWLETRVTDADGRVLHHVGDLDGDAITGAPPRLGAVELGADGAPLQRHRILELTAVRDKRVLGRAPREDVVRVPLPEDAVGPFEVRARWVYRRVPPEFGAWALRTATSPIPAHEIARAQATVRR